MTILRRACVLAATAAPVLASCSDLSGLASIPADAGGPEGGNAEGDAAPPAACPPGQKMCAGGGCVPLDAWEYGCGAPSCEPCSLPNAATVKCEAGRCAVATCRPGTASCDGKDDNGCEADLGDATTCGACTTACPDLQFCDSTNHCVPDCAPTELKCVRRCVDAKTSKTNCGGCGKVCAGAPNAVPACANGACTIECNVGYGDCDKALAGCEPLSPYYVDADGDGFGAGTKVGDACTAPAGHSTKLGDCLDSNPSVKPTQTQFFATGYTNASGKTSYDYDCNGVEENVPGHAFGACDSTCRTGDYVVNLRANAPAGANLYCGSGTVITTCSTSCSTSSASTHGCR